MSTLAQANQANRPHRGKTRERHDGADRRGRWGQGDLFFANVFFICYSIICFATVIVHCGLNQHAAGTSCIWALASATAGGVFGFLFGIPKILQSNRLPEESARSTVIDHRQQLNTNLTEISDWLTKIIVGLSLINLSKFPPYLTSMARTLAASIDHADPDPHMGFAYALLVCFSILGFLFGYLYTRLYLQGAFSRADQEAASSNQEETDARFKRLETVVDSYKGLIIHDRAQPPAAATAKGNGDVADDVAPDKRRNRVIATLYRMADEYLTIDDRVTDPSERLRL